MRLKKYIINEMSMPSWITNAFSKIKNEMSKMTFQQFKKKSEESFKEVIQALTQEEYENFLKRQNLNVKELEKEWFGEGVVNEDLKHWWDLVKTEMFPTLAFYPALQVWLEFDKMLKGTEYSGKVIGFYATFWLLLMSGKYIKGWFDWKKQNPSEYEKEREIGGGGII